MDKKQLDDYKREMMRLYGKSSPQTEETVPEEEQPEPLAETNNEENEPPYEAHSDETAEADVPIGDEETSENDDLDERYPEPDLTEIAPPREETDDTIEGELTTAEAEKSLGSSTGYILVNVRAGDESFAIEGAVVIVTAVIGGKRFLIASGIADSSGATQRFKVPVPEPELSQLPAPEERPYSLYDISVTAKGYFNARSVDVPVFSGITSIQDFSMVPVPLTMHEDDETLTIYNEEPFFGEGSENKEV